MLFIVKAPSHAFRDSYCYSLRGLECRTARCLRVNNLGSRYKRGARQTKRPPCYNREGSGRPARPQRPHRKRDGSHRRDPLSQCYDRMNPPKQRDFIVRSRDPGRRRFIYTM
ncbi:hypothetical protein BCR34DRAFT_342887 [Clohesyomyces aquaticus]|uniref:Uncharacterized protein n=1 Tax=Clohesyomyces aquaticus TaxID=1231657 RepID=A0A1Y2A7R4_9PLEO|nr:hypothetical protein BCR34DRAFT_342887 [Clohesyomyces aquaticus]